MASISPVITNTSSPAFTVVSMVFKNMVSQVGASGGYAYSNFPARQLSLPYFRSLSFFLHSACECSFVNFLTPILVVAKLSQSNCLVARRNNLIRNQHRLDIPAAI